MDPLSRWDISAEVLPCSLAVTCTGRVWLVDAEHRLLALSGAGDVEQVDAGALAGHLAGAAPRGADDLWLLVRGEDGRNRLATWRPGQAPEDVELPAEPVDLVPLATGELLYIAADRSLYRLRGGRSEVVPKIRCSAAAANARHLACVRVPGDELVVAPRDEPRWRPLQQAGARKLVGITPGDELVLLQLNPWLKGEGPPPSDVLLMSLSGQERTLFSAPVAMAAVTPPFLAAAVLSPSGGILVELYRHGLMDQANASPRRSEENSF